MECLYRIVCKEKKKIKPLTWCLLSRSCFPRWRPQCHLARAPSAPSPTSSVSGRSPERQGHNRLSRGTGAVRHQHLVPQQPALYSVFLTQVSIDRPGRNAVCRAWKHHGSVVLQSDGEVIEHYIKSEPFLCCEGRSMRSVGEKWIDGWSFIVCRFKTWLFDPKYVFLSCLCW